MNTIAPPISQHERLQIHITHDMVSYPSLDTTIYQTFSRVMAQVEGGDLLVLQRGSESAQRRASAAGLSGSGKAAGWHDGPWWRDAGAPRSMGIVAGAVEASKLSRASAAAHAAEFFAARGGLDAALRRASSDLAAANPVRSSDIFVAIQAAGFAADGALFAGPPDPPAAAPGLVLDAPPDEQVAFAVFLHDPVHAIDFGALSQAFPRRWADWLDAEAGGDDDEPQLPGEIAEIVRAGGVDPREWVAEWVEEILALAVGVVAQRYVARRMGVGEGGIGRGKAKDAAIEAGAGEAARAGAI